MNLHKSDLNTERKRLLHLLAYTPRGTRTIDHLLLEIASQAAQRGWEVKFGFTGEPCPVFAKRLELLGASWFLFEYPLTIRRVNVIRSICGNWQPDVIQTSYLNHFHFAYLWLKLSGFGKRLIVLDHSSGSGPLDKDWRTPLRKLRGRIFGHFIDAIATVSRYVAKRDVERVYLPERKVVVIYNGIDFDRYRAPVRHPSAVLKLVFAGQLIPEKGVQTLLQGLALLRSEGCDTFQLRIAGEGHYRPNLEALVSELKLQNHVQFLGHIDTMPELLADADIVIVPSVWAEAFGYVLIEAMASGAAILASDAGAIPEVVGNAGLIFRAGDAEHLAEQLKLLVNDVPLRLQFSQLGRQRVSVMFRIERKSRHHLDLCEAILNGYECPMIPVTPPPLTAVTP